jgi:hypothetical protein
MAFMAIENERVAALGRARNRHWSQAFQGESPQIRESVMRTLQITDQRGDFAVLTGVGKVFFRQDF